MQQFNLLHFSESYTTGKIILAVYMTKVKVAALNKVESMTVCEAKSSQLLHSTAIRAVFKAVGTAVEIIKA